MNLVPDDHVIVLFGATGDLARRKLLPGLYRLADAGLLPERYRIVGTSRSSLDDGEFRQFARGALEEFAARSVNGGWDAFAQNLAYAPLGDGGGALAAAVERAERDLGGDPRRLHYLSVPPGAFGGIVETLGSGAVAVAVASGKFGAFELRAAGADHVLGSLAEPLPL